MVFVRTRPIGKIRYVISLGIFIAETGFCQENERIPKQYKHAIGPYQQRQVCARRTGARRPRTTAPGSGWNGSQRGIRLEHLASNPPFRDKIRFGSDICGALDLSRQETRQYLRGGPVILLRFKSNFSKTLIVAIAIPNWT
jgi:hypothetical protein